jgi:hypothetical protein
MHQHININMVNFLLGESVVAVPVIMLTAILIAMEKLFGGK